MFVDDVEPRPFDEARFIKSEGGIGWVRGVNPCQEASKA